MLVDIDMDVRAQSWPRVAQPVAQAWPALLEPIDRAVDGLRIDVEAPGQAREERRQRCRQVDVSH